MTEFKPTDLGDLPAEWEVVRLGELADVKYGKAKPQTDGLIPAVGSGGIYAWVGSSFVDFPTLVIGRKGTAGRVWFMDKPCWPSDTTFYLEWKTNIDITFLYSYLMLHPLSGEHAKTTLPSLQRPDLENYPIPLPPLDEQRKIAHVLNSVQQAIAAQADLIAAAQELKRSLLRRLFTYGPGPEPAPTKETTIGEVPKHWEVVDLQQVVDIIYGIQAAVAHLTDSSIGIPILTNINMTLEGKLDFSTLRYYELSEKQEDKLLQKGDVLFNWRSGSPHHVGKTAIFNMDGGYTFSSFILRFRVTEGMSNIYLAYYLHWLKEQDFFVQNRQQSSVNSVFNKSAASEIPTIVPPLEEQHQIAHILQSADAKIATEEDRKAALRELFNSLLQELMTGKLRVNGLEIGD